MNKLNFALLFILLQVNINLFAGYAPTIVQDSLKALYPNLKSVGWSTDQNYYIAGFQHNGFQMKVWFNTKGNWIMKQTDWQAIDEVPATVYHSFTYGSYSSDEVLDVTYVEFPNKPAQIVILIGESNTPTQYQLFYRTNGMLINARNTTNMNNILGASTFL